jgi:hypothetical protein
MRNAMKQLGKGLGVLFALGTSSAALAYPPQCFDVCSCSSSCTKICYDGTYPTNCGDGGYSVCIDYCRSSAPQASASPSSSQDEQEQQDASQNVCSEKTEQVKSAKS